MTNKKKRMTTTQKLDLMVQQICSAKNRTELLPIIVFIKENEKEKMRQKLESGGCVIRHDWILFMPSR